MVIVSRFLIFVPKMGTSTSCGCSCDRFELSDIHIRDTGIVSPRRVPEIAVLFRHPYFASRE